MVEELMQEMVVLYCFLMIGFVMAKFRVLSNRANQVLAKLILNITLPALIIFSLYIPFSFAMLKEFSWLIGMSLYILSLSIVLAKWMGKRLHHIEERRSVYESLIIFGNQGFIGYAVIYALFAEDGIVYLAVFNIIYLLLIWTYGIYLFNKNERLFQAKRLLNPGLTSTLIGIVFFLLPVPLPSFAIYVLEDVGKMTIPLSMMFIGSLLASEQLKGLIKLSKDTFLWKAAWMKLLLIPILILVFALLSVPKHLILIAAIVSGMPSAPTISLYAQEFGGDALYAATGVFLSTALCMITIPSLIILIHMLIGI